MKSYFVDSFTSEPFKGNPAGVCLTDHAINEEKMLHIAKEFGFSETAFIQKTAHPGIFKIRYFSPVKEIPLCGHATLASAKILFRGTEFNEIQFVTVENIELVVKKAGEKICMEFPLYPLTPLLSVPRAMLDALGIDSVLEIRYSEINKIIQLEIADPEKLAALRPDFSALKNSYDGINGVLVTAPGRTRTYDFHYRYFWPWAGTNEDPVTGGVQTFLTKYWAEKLGKNRMTAFQSSERTGVLEVELTDEKVLIFGSAVIVLEGLLMV